MDKLEKVKVQHLPPTYLPIEVNSSLNGDIQWPIPKKHEWWILLVLLTQKLTFALLYTNHLHRSCRLHSDVSFSFTSLAWSDFHWQLWHFADDAILLWGVILAGSAAPWGISKVSVICQTHQWMKKEKAMYFGSFSRFSPRDTKEAVEQQQQQKTERKDAKSHRNTDSSGLSSTTDITGWLWSQKLHNNMYIWDLCPVFPPLCEF